jgi:hypothetical protein
MGVNLVSIATAVAVVVVALGLSGGVWAQGGGLSTVPSGEMVTTTVRGRVVNAVTKQPVARALVDTGGNGFPGGAALTNDTGQFELKIQEYRGGGPNGVVDQFQRGWQRVTATKPGFLPVSVALQSAMDGTIGSSNDETQAGVTIAITPEALIVGRVEVPGSEGEVRIRCSLYRREFRLQSGTTTWVEVRSFETWNDGEFRFSELHTGTYKLITHEQMDRDAQLQIPGMRMFGYPPMYYPNTTDFSAANEIKVKAGETAQVNLRVEKREYFPVRMPLRNMPVGSVAEVKVTPVGGQSPGWSLGYMPGEDAIGGTMPNGNYAVTVNVRGQGAMSGSAILSVKGRPAEGPAVVLVPNADVTVNIHEEFTANNTQDSATGQTGNVRSYVRASAYPRNVHVALVPADELNASGQMPLEQAPEGGRTGTQVLRGVPPGSYRVVLFTDGSYAAAVQSGGVDLLRQPVVVGIGGTVAPIEITLRNDGGEVSGTVVDNSGAPLQGDGMMPNQLLFLVPEDGGLSNFRMGMSMQGGAFQIPQVPPGDYVLLSSPPGETEFRQFDNLEEFEGKGQKVHVEAGAKVNVKVVAERQ